MKDFIAILLFVLLPIFLFPQSDLDSLWNTWKDNTLSDTIRSEALEDYIYQGHFNTNPDSAIIYAKVLLDFNEKTNNEIGKVNALKLEAYNFFRMGRYTESLNSYEKGFDIAKSIDYKYGMAEILMQTGYVYHDNEDIILALDYFKESLKLFEEVGDETGVSFIYNEFGSIYRTEGEFDKSLDYYLKSIAINSRIGNDDDNAVMYLNIGSLYRDHGDFEKGLDYMQKGLEIFEKYQDKLGIASGLAGIGSVHVENNEPDKALDYFENSLSISNEIDDIQGSIATMLDLSNIYIEKGKLDEAIGFCKKSLDLAKEIGDIGGQESAFNGLYECHKALGKTSLALSYLEEMLTVSDSIKGEATMRKLQEIEFSKQLLKDSLLRVEEDIKIEMAHQSELHQKDRINNLAIGLGLFFLLLSGGLYSRWKYIKNANTIIEKERDRSESLLLNILPAEIAEELKEKGEAAARDFDLVSILFTDFKGYTEKSEKLSAKELVDEINACFKAFDHICDKYGIEKIKTIGDAYMAAGGLPVKNTEFVKNTVLAALEMQLFILDRAEVKKAKNEIPFEMRVGIHTGPVVAGIVGVRKFQYDIWGDTVNTASRMESHGNVGKVNISQHTYEILQEDPNFTFESREKIEIKGKKDMKMWFVELA